MYQIYLKYNKREITKEKEEITKKFSILYKSPIFGCFGRLLRLRAGLVV